MKTAQLIFYISIFITLSSCKLDSRSNSDIEQDENSKATDAVKNHEEELNIEKHLSEYRNLKLNISKQQESFKSQNDIESEDRMGLAKSYIFEILVDSIFPYWIGTKWDFNGITENPRDGEIACGYFVTTTLRDIGFKLNRYKIAQKAASDIIFELCDRESIKRISGFQKLTESLYNVNDNEILIVGLDFHVGFIFKRNDLIYFAHSNYIDRKGVVIEPIQESDALKNSNLYVLGNLTKNKRIITDWLN